MKPSKINILKAKKALFLLVGYRALTWKGIVYCKNKSDIELINSRNEISSNFEAHEMTHVRQAESTHDSWLCFYSLYLWYWVLNFPLFIYGKFMPYFFIPFELEAMNNEIDWKYPINGSVYQWKKFKKFSLKTKLNLAKQYKESFNIITFKQYVRKVIYPMINED